MCPCDNVGFMFLVYERTPRIWVVKSGKVDRLLHKLKYFYSSNPEFGEEFYHYPNIDFIFLVYNTRS